MPNLGIRTCVWPAGSEGCAAGSHRSLEYSLPGQLSYRCESTLSHVCKSVPTPQFRRPSVLVSFCPDTPSLSPPLPTHPAVLLKPTVNTVWGQPGPWPFTTLHCPVTDPPPATSSGPQKPIGLPYWTLGPVPYTHTPAGDLGKQDSGIREGHGKLLVSCLLGLPDGSLGLPDGSRFAAGHSHRKL